MVKTKPNGMLVTYSVIESAGEGRRPRTVESPVLIISFLDDRDLSGLVKDVKRLERVNNAVVPKGSKTLHVHLELTSNFFSVMRVINFVRDPEAASAELDEEQQRSEIETRFSFGGKQGKDQAVFVNTVLDAITKLKR
ncbi:MAG TPA: hypothetical protein VD907_02955 [Verrucomicrobiae bacterium]|nr:hypothetical protein [Verrucomicrobiae bacterium]